MGKRTWSRWHVTPGRDVTGGRSRETASETAPRWCGRRPGPVHRGSRCRRLGEHRAGRRCTRATADPFRDRFGDQDRHRAGPVGAGGVRHRSTGHAVAHPATGGTEVPRHGTTEITLEHLARHTSGLPRSPTPFSHDLWVAVVEAGNPYAELDEATTLSSLARMR